MKSALGTEYASLPFWAPDGRSIGFFADGRIKRIDLQSGLVQPISTAAVPAGAAWNSDGVILHPLVPDSPLFRTSVSGSPLVPATQLAPGQTGHRGPAFLPDGRHFLFYAMGSTTVRASTWVSSARWWSGVCSTRTRQPSSRHRITSCICSIRRSRSSSRSSNDHARR